MDVAALRQRIARIAPVERCPAALASTGHEGMDAALGGGLLRGRLHEIFAGENDDASSAAGFAAMLALRLAQPGQAPWLNRTPALDWRNHSRSSQRPSAARIFLQ